MSTQALAVAVIVAVCAVYAAWVLMPAAWRQPLARRLLAWPLLSSSPALRRAATVKTGCGCDGCDAASGAQPPTKTVHIVRRR